MPAKEGLSALGKGLGGLIKTPMMATVGAFILGRFAMKKFGGDLGKWVF